MHSPRLLIGTPAYGHQVTVGYMRSILAVTDHFRHHGIKSDLLAFGNESLITRARNSIVAHFLGNESYTHLLFIDADISFQPQAVMRLLEKDAEAVAACYPTKAINWNHLRAQVAKEQNNQRLLAKSLDYVVALPEGDIPGTTSIVIEPDGFAKVTRVGTGFLLLKRSVFTRMMEFYPDAHYVNHVAGYLDAKGRPLYWTFFDTMIEPKTKHYLSEDYAFCYKWLKTGGDLWLDLETPLTHHGQMDYVGNVATHIDDMLQAYGITR